MYNTSILKDADQNIETQTTDNDNIKWVPQQEILKVRAQFKSIQIMILNMFTLAKSQLTAAYHQIVTRVKTIEKCLSLESPKLLLTFTHMLHEIEADIQGKIDNMTANVSNMILPPFSFDQLLSFVGGPSTNQAGQSSQKRINNSSISSGNRLTQKAINQTVADLESISANQYRSALKIKPSDKRVENLGCLSGKWDVLEELNLENKKITLMIPLSTVIAETLQEINLSQNHISQLDFLKAAQYPILRVLNLNKNAISHLEGLQDGRFVNLKILNLSENRIKKLDQLPNCHFHQLIELNVSSNRIEKGQPLIQCNFPKLQVLNLDRNAISSMDFIVACSFYRLKILSFCFNDIASIDCLGRCKLGRLEALLGYNNRIGSIDFLQFCEYPQLRQIVLNNNAIEDIGVVERLRFEKLGELDLENNRIKAKEVMCFVTGSEQCRRARKKFPFIQL